MNKEQGQKEFLRIIDEVVREKEEIVRKAKESGTWVPGLDSNRELFVECDDRAKKKIELLSQMVNEES